MPSPPSWFSERMLANLRALKAEMGTVNAVIYLLARAINFVTFRRATLETYAIVAQPVPVRELTPARRGRSIAVTEEQGQAVLTAIRNRPDGVLRDRMARGYRCLLARKDGQVVGYQWFSLFSYAEDEVRCVFKLEPQCGCAWDFDVFVAPAARTQPVFLRLWDTCNGLLREAGIAQTLSRISVYNGASLRAHERMGARRIATAAFLRWGSVQVSLFSMRPWLYVSLTPAQVPVLAVGQLAQERTRSSSSIAN